MPTQDILDTLLQSTLADASLVRLDRTPIHDQSDALVHSSAFCLDISEGLSCIEKLGCNLTRATGQKCRRLILCIDVQYPLQEILPSESLKQE